MKRIFAVFLVALMVLSFASCDKKANVETNGIPILKWYVPGDKQLDMETVMDKANKIVEDKVGARLDIQFIDAGAFKERMNMSMATREDVDLYFTGYCNPYVSAVRNAGLYCLDGIIDTVPDLVGSLPETIWEAAKVNGKLYGVPNYQLCAFSNCLVINKKLAKKYDLDLSKIKKTTDIEPFLDKIKENEPDYYPISVSWGTDAISAVDDTAYIVENGCRMIPNEDGSYKVESVFDDKFKQKAKILNDWFKKGYVRPDSASVMNDTTDVKAGKYAVVLANYKPGVEAELKTNNGYEVVIAKISPTVFRISQPLATMISISATCKYPEKALKVIELLNTDKELYNMVCFGIEGKHYNKAGENRIELIEKSGYTPNASWKFGNQFNAYLLPEQTDDCWEISQGMNDSADVIGVPGFVFDDTNVRIQLAQLTTVIDKYNIIKTGAEDPDTYFDKYLKELDDAGLKDIMNEYQKQLDEYCKN